MSDLLGFTSVRETDGMRWTARARAARCAVSEQDPTEGARLMPVTTAVAVLTSPIVPIFRERDTLAGGIR
jgi:hypothetical protein